MARLNVNPTRMEMTRLKGQLKTATRGHKLLKDKLDELMKQFMEIVRENKRLREEAETALENAYKNFIIARAVLSEASLGEALMIPQQSVSVKVTKKNIMSVNVPVFDFQKEGGGDGNIFPYGMAFTSGELDSAMLSFSDAMEPLLRLAESEKTAQLLAQEIERTRRRVNALENVMIPNYQETIKYITMKLEENERANTTELAKLCYFSEYHFMRFFKKHMNMTCIQYINNIRLEKAVELFEHGNTSILEVSLSVGFHNLSYFYRAFKAKYHMTPLAFIKRLELDSV